MNKSPDLEELLTQDPIAVRIKAGVPHPLAHWGINGKFVDGLHANVILDFIHDTFQDKDSDAYKGAVWFLLESEHAYFFACEHAGIDAVKLRNHLAHR